MADRKISELTQITGANVDDANDEIAIVDTSASETKAITRAELMSSVSAMSVDGDLTVDTDTLYVDSANDRVGINTDSPVTSLDIAGGLRVNQTDALELQSLAVFGGFSYFDDNVGIKTSIPGAELDVTGDAIVSGDFTVDTDTLFVDASTNSVGINNASPSASLDVTGDAKVSGDLTVDTDTFYVDSANDRVGIGTSSPDEKLEVIQGAGATTRAVIGGGDQAIFVVNGDRDNSGDTGLEDSALLLATDGPYDRSLNGGFGTYGYRLGAINEAGANGLKFTEVRNNVDIERMRIDKDGNVLVGKSSPGIGTSGFEVVNNVTTCTADGDEPLEVNRKTDDGVLIRLRQDGAQEGSISVSGTTVSYNGGHLSRWSRLPEGTEDTHIYKGTVMTNLDEMCEWRDEQGDLEDNEQLNKTTVSTQEGDPNVAGLFVAWDEDDDWGDYYLAMTGDLVIRIAQGVTVQRGDLLMSAGDGTAKPQGDDIVRSKTVAKVTSTNVSHTYPDGSYAVPCVVMAC